MKRISIRYTGETEPGIVYESENQTFLVHYPCSSSSVCFPYEVHLEPGIYNIECWGASGYDQMNDFSLGGLTTGVLSLLHSQTFYVYIGSQGVKSTSPSYNGGGSGSTYGFSGGGATDIRLIDGHYSNFSSLLSRIMVAGGGGGYNIGHSTWPIDGNIQYFGEKGNSLGIIGGRGFLKRHTSLSQDIILATGGTQRSGGIGGNCTSPCHHGPKSSKADGKFGLGGNGTHELYNAGGGGGYFGGGAGHSDNNVAGGGGGGSSYISGLGECVSVSPCSTPDNIISSQSPIHFSGYRFYNPFIRTGSFGDGLFVVSDVTHTYHSPLLSCSFYDSMFNYVFNYFFNNIFLLIFIAQY